MGVSLFADEFKGAVGDLPAKDLYYRLESFMNFAAACPDLRMPPKAAAVVVQTVASSGAVPLVEFYDSGEIQVLNGDVFTNGTVPPPDAIEVITLVECDSVVKAKVVVVELPDETIEGHLWLAGDARARVLPGEGLQPCAYVLEDPGVRVVTTIDEEGKLRTRGLVYARGVEQPFAPVPLVKIGTPPE